VLRTPGTGRREGSRGLFNFKPVGLATLDEVTGSLLVFGVRVGVFTEARHARAVSRSFITSV
jgi:hypothetical protein